MFWVINALLRLTTPSILIIIPGNLLKLFQSFTFPKDLIAKLLGDDVYNQSGSDNTWYRAIFHRFYFWSEKSRGLSHIPV